MYEAFSFCPAVSIRSVTYVTLLAFDVIRAQKKDERQFSILPLV